jgi:hypothetical protein
VRAPAGTLARLPIVVTNTGSGPLPPVPVAPGTFGVSYRLLGPDGAATCQARRTPLLRTLEPGESAELTVEIEAPLACGRHSVELGLVHEGYRWLAIEGEAELEVGPPPSQLFRQEHPGGFVSLVATRADRRRWSVPDALVREDDPASAAARAIAIARETGATRLLCVGAGPVGRALATELAPSAATVVLDEMEEPALAARILEHAPDLAVVGRPAAGCEAQRLSLVPSLRDRLEAPLRLLALGALRDLALIVAERWAALPDVEVGGIWLDGDGILDVGIAPRRDGAARP